MINLSAQITPEVEAKVDSTSGKLTIIQQSEHVALDGETSSSETSVAFNLEEFGKLVELARVAGWRAKRAK